MLPKVILHNVASVDGRIEGFQPDLGLFYGLAGRWEEDATLVGSETALSAPLAEEEASQAGEGDPSAPLLAVVDSRGRVRNLHLWPRFPYWRAAVALASRSTPPDHLAYLDEHGLDRIVAGEDRVDLRAALEELAARYGVRTIRVDGGGTLNGALLAAGLVDEISVLVSPLVVGRASPHSLFWMPSAAGEGAPIRLTLLGLERLAGDHAWLRYEVEQ